MYVTNIVTSVAANIEQLLTQTTKNQEKMKNLFCLTDQAIQVLKTPGVKWKLMFALEINDTRTLDKHVKNNFPNSPLMNFNVREIIRDVSPNLEDRDIYRKLSHADIERVKKTRQKMQEQNAKYNNLKKQGA